MYGRCLLLVLVLICSQGFSFFITTFPEEPSLQTKDGEAYLFPVKIGRSWGYIDGSGNLAVEPKFDDAARFSEGMARVKLGDKRGYIDLRGNVVIPMQYREANDFSEGLALVRDFDYSYHVIGKRGDEVLRVPVGTDIQSFGLGDRFTEGLFRIKIGSSWGYIDSSGAVAIRPRFRNAYEFRDGIALTEIGDDYAYIDKQGDILFSVKARFAGNLVDGMAVVCDEGRCGFIDLEGRVATKRRFASARDFSESLAAVQVDSKAGKWGYINKRGELIAEPQFLDAFDFSEGYAAVAVRKEQEGYIDRTGKLVIPARFSLAYPFKHGLARVEICDKSFSDCKIGYINTAGNYVWNPMN